MDSLRDKKVRRKSSYKKERRIYRKISNFIDDNKVLRVYFYSTISCISNGGIKSRNRYLDRSLMGLKH